MLAKPGIVFSVSVTGLTGMFLAARGVPDNIFVAAICLACIILSASGSAIMNVILDAKMDVSMPRLNSRVEAFNRIGKPKALVISISFIVVSIALSAIYINALTTFFVITAVFSYTVLYTLYLKRRSPYGTIMGGLPGALPVLGGYSAISGALGPEAVILFLIMMLWQSPHFWALALKYQDDYKAAGVPVLPLAYGEQYTKILIFIYGTALLPLTLSLWCLGFASGYFAWFAFVLGGAFLYDCYINIVKTRQFGRAFRSSIIYIMALFLALNIDIFSV